MSSSTKGNLNKLFLVKIYFALGKIACLEIRLHGKISRNCPMK